MRHALRGQRPEQPVAVNTPAAAKGGPAPSDVMSLQATIGNAAVGQLLGARARASGEQATAVDRQTQDAIESQAGGGEALSEPLRREMQGIAGGPIDGVRLHRNEESDRLARTLGATAFTQGRDVFLRSDRDPASAQGRATLAHELSHVARGSVGAGAVLREPDAQPMDTSQDTGVIAVGRVVLDGSNLEGESKIAGHEGELDFTSLGQAVSNRAIGGGAGGQAPSGDFLEITGTRLVDKASPKLAEANAKGTPITEARFVFVKRGDDGKYSDAFTMEFKEGFITSYSATSNNGMPSEGLSIQFKTAEDK